MSRRRGTARDAFPAVPQSRRIAATLLLLLALPAAAEVPADAAAQVLPSVVALRVFGSGRDGYGAGVIVTEEGHVLTALHVVEDAAAIAATLADGEELPAKIVARDKPADLALLSLVAPGRTFAPATLAKRSPNLGETVLAVSNPFGIGVSVTRGVLSARGRRGIVKDNVLPLLQTDAAINPGSSGGALVDLHGEVVGLITAILSKTGGHQGVGFAVPARELARALPALRAGRTVRRPWLGVRVAPRRGGGLVVRSVVPGGPAHVAGIQAGDRLVRLRGKPLAGVRELKEALRSSEVGRKLRFEVRRGEERLRLEVEIGYRTKR